MCWKYILYWLIKESEMGERRDEREREKKKTGKRE